MFYTPILKSLISLVVVTMQPDGYEVVDGYGHKYMCGNTLGGAHHSFTNKIDICNSADDKYGILFHELGHFVYFSKLNDKQRDGWQKICGGEKIFCQELFAENFRYKIIYDYVGCSYKEQDCEIKEEFMRRVIFLLLDPLPK